MEIDARIIERLNYYRQKLHNTETELLRVRQRNQILKEQLTAQQPIPGLTPGKLLSLIEDFCGPGSDKMVINEVTVSRGRIEAFVDYIINLNVPVDDIALSNFPSLEHSELILRENVEGYLEEVNPEALFADG